MVDDPNLALLAIVHELQSVSKDAQMALSLAIARSVETNVDRVSLPLAGAQAMLSLLKIQNRTIVNLMESNQEVADMASSLLDKLEK